MTEEPKPKNQGITFTDCAAAAALIALSFILSNGNAPAAAAAPAAQSGRAAAAGVAFSVSPDSYANLRLLAKAAYVLDVKDGKPLFSLNGDLQLPLASLTKIMTTLTTLSIARPDMTITLKKEYLEVDGGANNLFVDEKWKLGNLLALTLVESSNGGATALAASAGALLLPPADAGNATTSEKAFVEKMNEQARKFGLAETYFINPTGLDESSRVSGGYGSARDVASLFASAVSRYPSLFAETTHPSITVTSESGITHVVQNTDEVVNEIPLLLGSKTGYTDLAGGNLAVEFNADFNRPIVIVLLGSTFDGRFSDMLALVSATREYLANESAVPAAARGARKNP